MRKLIAFAAILSLLVLAGCSRKVRGGETAIEDINKDPKKFYGQQCVIRGLITKSYDIPLVKHDVFKVHDSTGEIWIYSEIGVPPERIEVRVRGTLKKFIKLPFKLPVGIEIGYFIKLEKLEFLRI